MKDSILVTGGLGFIGSHYIRMLLKQTSWYIVNIDKATYAANLFCQEEFAKQEQRYCWVKADIQDTAALETLFEKYQFTKVVHFAAESHVDNSIKSADDFINTNIVGTHQLLQVAYRFWQTAPHVFREGFKKARFLQVSTDEVFGALDKKAPAFTSKSPFAPNSPYSASKASADLLARSYFHTYGFPVIKTHCSNNYGAFQHAEKLIPTLIRKALAQESLPLYGDGKQVRDWIYVEDHCQALFEIFTKGTLGASYLIGADQELENIEITQQICLILDRLLPRENKASYSDLISFVKDRPGHDLRYAIATKELEQQLNWKAKTTLEEGLEKTVRWYIKQLQ